MQGIGLRAYGQEDPVRPIKMKALNCLEEMIASIQEDTVKYLFHIQKPGKNGKRKRVANLCRNKRLGKYKIPQMPNKCQIKRSRFPKLPGSGKKYKKCCGA